MKRAFKRPQTIVYRACRIVAMRLTYTFAQDISFEHSTDVSRPLTEFARSFLTSFEGEGKGRWTGRVGGEFGGAKTFRAGKIVGLDRRHRVLGRTFEDTLEAFFLDEINLVFLERFLEYREVSFVDGKRNCGFYDSLRSRSFSFGRTNNSRCIHEFDEFVS